MSSQELLNIDPQELKFQFELKKQISCSFQLLNKTDNHVAFKVKTTDPKKYSVRPNNGVVLPRSTSTVTVTMQAQREAPPDMQCKDRFLVQSVVVPPGSAPKDITPQMFNKEAGNVVEECKLRVAYVSPPRPPSPVPEESEEGTSPRSSESKNGIFNPTDFKAARDVITNLTNEKNSILRQNDELRRELGLLKLRVRPSGGGVSIVYVILIGLIGIVLGYLMTK